jgi:formylglycine-generating enzyme required for sulfatase activity
MIGRSDTFEEAIAAVDSASDHFSFSELVNLASKSGAFNTSKHLRFADWSGVDFSRSDLNGFDFTGARLLGCDFTDARITKARFDQTIIDVARPYALLNPQRTLLRKARDWDAYLKGWRRSAAQLSDEHLPIGAVFQDAPFAPEMVVIPAGSFTMRVRVPEKSVVLRLIGVSEFNKFAEEDRPPHPVTIARHFAVSRFPVTLEEVALWDPQWLELSRTLPSRQGDLFSDFDVRQPRMGISWNAATAYAKWLRAATGQPYRLLSEVEWEHCFRATSTRYFAKRPNERPNVRSFEVGHSRANALGLHGVDGSHWEWCQDEWHEDYDGAPDDGSARVSGAKGPTDRVVRGYLGFGRNAFPPDYSGPNIGFRLARPLNLSRSRERPARSSTGKPRVPRAGKLK